MCNRLRTGRPAGISFCDPHIRIQRSKHCFKDENVQMTKKWLNRVLNGNWEKCGFIFKLNSAYLTSMLICNLWDHVLFIIFPEMNEQRHTLCLKQSGSYLHFLTAGSRNSCVWLCQHLYNNFRCWWTDHWLNTIYRCDFLLLLLWINYIRSQVYESRPTLFDSIPEYSASARFVAFNILIYRDLKTF